MADELRVRSETDGCLLGTLPSAGNLQQIEGALLYRGRGSDHLAGFFTHVNGVQGYGAEIL